MTIRRAVLRPVGLRLTVEPGQWADYLALARYHYRAARPATVCSVWRLTAGPVGRSADSLLWRCGGYPSLAGVLVVSYPPPRSLAREQVTGRRYRPGPDAPAAMARLNREVRTISRVVIHPLYRGLGLASELVRAVLARLDAPLVEAYARMGRYVPFFARAGMRELQRPGRPVYYYRSQIPQENIHHGSHGFHEIKNRPQKA